jgi:two-component system chemotaxis response regulator CheB
VIRPELVVIGCSLGGLEATQGLLGALPPSMPAIVIVQHRLAGDEDRLSRLLRVHSRMPVVEPDDKTPITPGHVYIAPADYHLLVEVGWFSLSVDPPVKFARPSIDVLFESAARAYGPRVIAVVLTGASDDGADGAKVVRDRGGMVIVQDPDTAMSPIAPRAALARCGADKVRSLAELPSTLATLCGVRPRERGTTRPPKPVQ